MSLVRLGSGGIIYGFVADGDNNNTAIAKK